MQGTNATVYKLSMWEFYIILQRDNDVHVYTYNMRGDVEYKIFYNLLDALITDDYPPQGIA